MVDFGTNHNTNFEIDPCIPTHFPLYLLLDILWCLPTTRSWPSSSESRMPACSFHFFFFMEWATETLHKLTGLMSVYSYSGVYLTVKSNWTGILAFYEMRCLISNSAHFSNISSRCKLWFKYKLKIQVDFEFSSASWWCRGLRWMT